MIDCRYDLIKIFNNARFSLRHYAKGYYAVALGKMTAMPVNRLFMPLANPNGAYNFIADAGKKYILEPGKLYYIPAFLPTEFCLDEQLLFLSIHNNLEIFPGVDLFSGCSYMTVIENPPQVQELLALIKTAGENSYINSVRVGSLVFALQTLLMNYYAEKEFWKPLVLQEFSALMDFLKSHGTARTSVCDLAALRGETREHFTRHFSHRTGLTPKQLIDRFVMSRCLDLINSGYSFKETSESLEFSNEFAFSRYFKRNMGESPSHWLRHRRITKSLSS